MKNILLIFTFTCISLSQTLFAQSVGIGTTSPDSSALLDLTSDSMGILVPRMSASQRQAIPSPAVGLMVFDSTNNAFYYFTGNGWLELLAGSVDKIVDADGDTKIQVEENPDENIIRFDLEGTEKLNLRQNTSGMARLETPNNQSNVLLGTNAGLNASATNGNNTMIGVDAGKNVTTSPGNVFIGRSAGQLNVSNGGNTFVGGFAGQQNNGLRNVLIGYDAGLSNTVGNNNTMLGWNAGAAGSGSGNVFIGNEAGLLENGDNKLYIDNSFTSSPLLYGEFDNNKLRVNGSLAIVDGTQQNGYLFTSDGTGSGHWAPKDTLSLIADADGDTKIQVEESPDDNTVRIDIGGIEALTVRKNAAGFSLVELPSSGGNSTYYGQYAGEASDGSQYNSFFGKFSGQLTTSGSNNSFVGAGSGKNNQTGSNNTYLGYSAGLNATGSSNVCIGSNAGKNASGSNLLYIDNSATSDPLIFGDFSSNLLRINGTLNINNTFSFPTADGAAGQTLETDGSGTLTWVDNAGSDNQSIDTLQLNGSILQLSLENDGQPVQSVDLASINTLPVDTVWFSDGTFITTTPDTLGFYQDGTRYFTMTHGRLGLNTGKSISIGDQAGVNNTSLYGNIYMGFQAGMNDVSPFGSNIFLGDQAGRDNTTGNLNIGVGKIALQANTTGGDNIAVGTSTLYNNTTGEANVAMGVNAQSYNTTGSKNTAIGQLACPTNEGGRGEYNLGFDAGDSDDAHNKNRNVMLGAYTGYNNTGDDNIFIGYRAGYGSSGSNLLYIDNTDTPTPLIYGEFDNDLLRVNGTFNINNNYSLPDTDGTAESGHAHGWGRESVMDEYRAISRYRCRQ